MLLPNLTAIWPGIGLRCCKMWQAFNKHFQEEVQGCQSLKYFIWFCKHAKLPSCRHFLQNLPVWLFARSPGNFSEGQAFITGFFFSWWDPLQKHQLQPCWGGILYISHSWELQGHTTATYRKHRTIVRNTGFPTGMPEISYLWDFGNIQSKSACSSYLGLTSLWVRGCTGVKLHQPKDFHTLKILAFNQMHTEWCFDWPLDVQTSTTRRYQNSLRMVMSFSFFSLIVLLPL